MAFTLVVKNTSQAGKVPTAVQLQRGELAINLADQKLYSKNTSDEIFEIGVAGQTPSGGTDDRPDGPSIGDLYYDIDLGDLLVWNGAEWVPVGQEAIALNDLTDVDTAGVTDGMVISYDQASGEWKPVDPATFNPQAGRALTYDTTTNPDTLDADIATDSTLGVVSIGNGIDVDAAGEISVEIPPGTTISETAPQNPEAGQLWWADTDEDDGGGRLYVYTGDEWVDTSLPGAGSYLTVDQADDLYLSKTVDDTAQGNIEFKKVSRHRNGLSVGSSDQANFYIQTGDTKSIALHPRGDSTPVSIGYNSTDTVYQAVTTLPSAIDKKNRNGYQVNLSRNNVYVNNNQEVRAFNCSVPVGDDLRGIENFYGFQVNLDGSTQAPRNSYGFHSQMNKVAGGRESFGFYASGDAPNYFLGDTDFGGSLYVRSAVTFNGGTAEAGGNVAGVKVVNENSNTCRLVIEKQGGQNNSKAIQVLTDGGTEQWSVQYNGVASFSAMSGSLRDVQIEMDADQPTAYTSTFAIETDEEGNEVQVENSTYSGTTESLLEIIRDLRARVAALEGA
jgi:hypothetical protein